MSMMLRKIGLMAMWLAATAPAFAEDDERRTGWPYALACWARPSNTPSYIGYLVGGGAGHRHKAEGPTEDEGTWGWDYQGLLLRRRVALGWWHGRRYQGGSGAYRTDGPHVLPPLSEK